MTTIDPNIAFSSASTDRTLSTRAPAKRGWAIAGVSPAQTTDPLTRLGLSRYAIAARPQTCRSSSSSGVDVPPRKAAVFWKGEPGTRSQCR